MRKVDGGSANKSSTASAGARASSPPVYSRTYDVLADWKSALHLVILTIAALSFFAACSRGTIQPVEISDGDICSFCKMAISEKRYACELVNRFGEATKFDDIGCMKNYIIKQHPEPSAVFVVDFNTKQWIDSKKAFFVHSSQLQAPMSGETAAFATRQDAEDAAKKYQGVANRTW